jgi:hypothetical protein
MKPSVAYLGVLAACVLSAVPALAQEYPANEPPPGPAAPFVQPPIQGQVAVEAPPVPTAQGEWVNQGDGPVWVPAGATTYAYGAQPYVYLYTPVSGWAWYHSPWGWGPYSRGPWLSAHWARGWRGGPGVGWAAPHAAFGHYAGIRGATGFHGYGAGGFHGGEFRGGGFHGGGFHGGGFHGGGFHGRR